MNKNTSHTPIKLLVIGGHPADIFDNAGGTLLHHIQRGDSVTALAITPGARVHDIVVQEEMRRRKEIPKAEELNKIIQERTAIKRQEIIEACNVFSITDVRFLEFDDHLLLLNEKIVCQIARLIREIRPTIIITHYPFDNGGLADQHAITSSLVLHAATVACSVEPGDSNPPHRTAQIFFMATPSQQLRNTVLYREFNAHADVYIDISDAIHLKLEAMDKLKSQQYDGSYARKRIETIDGNLGLTVGVAYAEAFISYLPEVQHTLPVGDFLIKKTNEPQRELFDRIGDMLSTRNNSKSVPQCIL
jgi:LmbE family N-acetylglucosaminyl deacetylase